MLKHKRFKLLMRILESGHRHRGVNKMFDRRDNCIQLSNRKISKIINVPISTINRLFNDCLAQGIIKKVFDISGIERLMINPRWYWKHHYLERPFNIFVFDIGDYYKAVEWRNRCELLGAIICPLTGEHIKNYNWHVVNRYAHSYSRYDVNSRPSNK